MERSKTPTPNARSKTPTLIRRGPGPASVLHSSHGSQSAVVALSSSAFVQSNMHTSMANSSVTEVSTSKSDLSIENIDFVLGDKVFVSGDAKKHGKVKYIGYPPFSTGLWVGIELPIPNGRNDGSVQVSYHK